MTTVEEHPVKAEQISTGLSVLNKRQNKLKLMSLGTSTLFILSLVALYVQQDFVYSFFGLTQTVQQLHLPLSVGAAVTEFQNQPDYFFNLVKWFGWLILKAIVSFIGAFIVIGILKRFRFFLVRFQSFILKFVAWLIAVILIWGGLTYIQYDSRSDEQEDQYQLVHYDQHIQQSEISQLLNESETNETTKAYVLAQTALLHQPMDKDVARSYVAQLVKAERTNTHFLEYDFKPEQLWAMQHQVYGKSVSPTAQSVEPTVQKANQWIDIVRMILLAFMALSLAISLFLYIIASRLKGRALRIQQQMNI